MNVPERFNFARDVVEPLAAEDPGGCALTFVDSAGEVSRLTWGEVADGAARWSGLLAERSLRRGDRLLVLVGKTPDWHLILLGALRLGIVTIPCSEMLRAKDLDFRMRHSGASLLVANRGAEAEVAGDERVLPRRGRRTGCGSRMRGHARRRARVHPLHLGHDEGPQGRHAHARVHLREADAGRVLARRAARRRRLVHGGDGLGEVDLERLPRPVEPGRGDPPP